MHFGVTAFRGVELESLGSLEMRIENFMSLGQSTLTPVHVSGAEIGQGLGLGVWGLGCRVGGV